MKEIKKVLQGTLVGDLLEALESEKKAKEEVRIGHQESTIGHLNKYEEALNYLCYYYGKKAKEELVNLMIGRRS